MIIDHDARPITGETADVARFERVFRAEVDRVYSYARARLGDADAEDVVSDVFLAAALAIRDGNEAGFSGAWIMAVTKNKVIDHWRRAQRQKVRTMLLRQTESQLTQIDDWTDPGNRELVIDTLDQLSSRHRLLLVLHYVDCLSVPEIATELGQSISAVESVLARARRAFRATVAKQERNR